MKIKKQQRGFAVAFGLIYICFAIFLLTAVAIFCRCHS